MNRARLYGQQRGEADSAIEFVRPVRLEEAGMASDVDELKPVGSATFEDFLRLDIRVGRVLRADPFPEARKPAYKLEIDFGGGRIKHSSAQLVATYPDPQQLIGRLVIGVVNFPARRIAGFSSDVLVLGALPADGRIPLLNVDDGAQPGDRIG